MLKREPYSNIIRKLDISAKKPFQFDAPQDNAHTVLEKDTRQKSKFSMMFVDTSAKKNRISVREGDGTLRTASVAESWDKKYGKPKNFYM